MTNQNQSVKSFADLPRPRLSLKELAEKAHEKHMRSRMTAEFAAEGETLSAEELAQMQAIADTSPHAFEREEMAQAIKDLSEAREAVFTDGITRAAHLRIQIAQLASEEHPPLDRVLSLLSSACATRMRTKEGIRPAQPLLTVWKSYRDAVRHAKHPIAQPVSRRRDHGAKHDRFSAHLYHFLVPATVLDREVFGQLQEMLARMPNSLAAWLEADTRNLRSSVWYALHFLPGALINDKLWTGRIFEEQEGGGLKNRNNGKAYCSFELSPGEILAVESSEVALRIVDRLKAIADKA